MGVFSWRLAKFRPRHVSPPPIWREPYVGQLSGVRFYSGLDLDPRSSRGVTRIVTLKKKD